MVIFPIGLDKDAKNLCIQLQDFSVSYILTSWNGLDLPTRYTLLGLYASSLPFDLEDKVKVPGGSNVTIWSVNLLSDDVAKFVRRKDWVKEEMCEWCEQLFSYKKEEDEAMWCGLFCKPFSLFAFFLFWTFFSVFPFL